MCREVDREYPGRAHPSDAGQFNLTSKVIACLCLRVCVPAEAAAEAGAGQGKRQKRDKKEKKESRVKKEKKRGDKKDKGAKGAKQESGSSEQEEEEESEGEQRGGRRGTGCGGGGSHRARVLCQGSRQGVKECRRLLDTCAGDDGCRQRLCNQSERHHPPVKTVSLVLFVTVWGMQC